VSFCPSLPGKTDFSAYFQQGKIVSAGLILPGFSSQLAQNGEFSGNLPLNFSRVLGMRQKLQYDDAHPIRPAGVPL
jgi:hypothetical protein